MKLLFDENLSPKLPRLVAAMFPESAHARDCGLLGAPDQSIWEYARNHGYTVVSKDSDFYQRSLLHGHPPKLVWLRVGNCTRASLIKLITSRCAEINALGENPFEAVLVLAE